MRPRIKIYFDGGCRPSPIGMETAVAIQGRIYLQRSLGNGTSMEAEWRALLHAMEVAREYGITNPVFLGDALGVIYQVQGRAKCSAAAQPYFERLSAIASSPADLSIRHIKRTQNLAGIALAQLYR